MPSAWESHQLESLIIEVLNSVPAAHGDGHHMGRPFLTAYQIAIDLDRRHPGLVDALHMHMGGEGTGGSGPESLPRYVGNQLSRAIDRDPNYVIEGAFISDQDIGELTFHRADGNPIRSSTRDPSLFRVRVP